MTATSAASSPNTNHTTHRHELIRFLPTARDCHNRRVLGMGPLLQQTMKRLLQFLFGRKAKPVAPAKLPDYLARHAAAQDRGDFNR